MIGGISQKEKKKPSFGRRKNEKKRRNAACLTHTHTAQTAERQVLLVNSISIYFAS